MTMILSIERLEEIWNGISPYTGGFLLVTGDHPLAFHIGYISDENKCFIVLNIGKYFSITSSKAITAECIQLSDSTFSLKFTLNYPSLDELFIKLCWDLIDTSRNDTSPVEKIIQQYKSWQILLQKTESGVMSLSMQKGLIGELLYLEESINRMDVSLALQAWVGPEGSDQDFMFIDHWSEIKAVAISSNEVGISSLQQLDRYDKGFLVLYFIDKTTSFGQHVFSLLELITRIRYRLINSRDRDVFDCKIVKCGFINNEAERYNEFRYRLAEKRVFMVDNEFPRLTKKNVPSGVTNSKYWIDLSAIDPFRAEED